MVPQLTLVILFSTLATSSARTANLTVYRITPKNVTGDITDKNTGDAGGDLYFSIYELLFPLYCLEMPRDSSCSASSLNIPNFNVYEQSVVEVDTRFGVYSGCLPNISSGKEVWECHPYCDTELCWDDPRFSGPDGATYLHGYEGICNKSECVCSALLNKTIGRFESPMSQVPARWHKQTPMWIQIETISRTLNGSWYSTQTPGKCGENERPGDGKCFWKFHGVQRRVNATCVKKNIIKFVEAKNEDCFNKLPQPSNISTVDWVECFMTTITGIDYNQTKAPVSGGIPPHELLQNFERSFDPKVGCPVN